MEIANVSADLDDEEQNSEMGEDDPEQGEDDSEQGEDDAVDDDGSEGSGEVRGFSAARPDSKPPAEVSEKEEDKGDNTAATEGVEESIGQSDHSSVHSGTREFDETGEAIDTKTANVVLPPWNPDQSSEKVDQAERLPYATAVTSEEGLVMAEKLPEASVLTPTDELMTTIVELREQVETMEDDQTQLHSKIQYNTYLLAHKEAKIRKLAFYKCSTSEAVVEGEKEQLEAIRKVMVNGGFSTAKSSVQSSFGYVYEAIQKQFVAPPTKTDAAMGERLQSGEVLSLEEALQLTIDRLTARANTLEVEQNRLMDEVAKIDSMLEDRDDKIKILVAIAYRQLKQMEEENIVHGLEPTDDVSGFPME